MPRRAETWTESFRIRAYEADPRGYASIQTLCNYFQEAAGRHAASLGVVGDALGPHRSWVLSRLRVQVDAFPSWDDTVVVETWPSGRDRLYATRDFLIRAEQPTADDDVLARGTSAWLVLDLERRRPVRLPEVVNNLIVPERPRALSEASEPLDPPSDPQLERRFRIRYSDLDVNQHVNNVRYAEWAVESVPDDVLRSLRLEEIELQFRAETTFGDTVLGRTLQVNGAATVPHFEHRLVREADERDVAYARTRWTQT